MVLDILTRSSSGPRHEDALEFGLLFGLVAAAMATQAATAWTVRSAHQYLPEALSSPYIVSYVAVYVVGTALPALAYSRLRSVRLPRSLPTTSDLPVVVAAVLAPAVVVGIVALVGNALFDVTITETIGIVYAPAADPSYLLHRAGTLAVCGGLGLGLLVHGAAQGSLRDRIGPRHAVGVAAALGGVYYGVVTIAGNLLFSPAPLLTLLVVVAVAVGLGAGAGTLYRASVDDRRADTAENAVALLAVLAGIAFLLTGVDGRTDVLHGGLWMLAFGVAALGYERTGSLLVPILAVAAFLFSLELAAYLESLFGVV